jgi:glucan phosphoethanolaminetransferase (alkaline phosphatase superfamily)
VLFPEGVGAVAGAILVPYDLLQLFLQGRVFLSIAGFLVWFALVSFAVLLLRRRLYLLAGVPMLVTLGEYLLIHRFLI